MQGCIIATRLHYASIAHACLATSLQAGVVRLHCSASSPLVYTGCLDGVVRGWDVRSGGCVRQWHGHPDQILDIAVARYGCVYLMCTGVVSMASLLMFTN